MNKIKANISLHELTKLKQQKKFLLKELNAVPASPLLTIVVVITQIFLEVFRRRKGVQGNHKPTFRYKI